MPATPFHLPPSAVVGWPARRHVDLPALLLANLAIDVEPGVAMLLDLEPPPHGVVHTLVGATVVGAATGWVWWRLKGVVERVLGGDYPLQARTAVVSAAAGGWLHVLLDSVMYDHLRPLYPLSANPLHVAGSQGVLHLLGALALAPAAALLLRARAWRTVPEKVTAGLLGVSAVAMVLYAAAGIL